MSYLFFLTVISGAFVAGTGVVPGMLILLRYKKVLILQL